MTEERDINEMRAKIIKLENNLHDTNDLALAQLEGEDMTEFGDIIAYRHDLRVQIAELKAQVAKAEKEEKDPDVPTGHENWSDLIGHFLPYGKIVRHGDKLFKVIIPHAAQADWAPDVATTLFTIYHEESRPEWVQPTAAHDAYAKDDEVAHNGKAWKSDVDANVWEPGVYGWTQIED